MNILFIADILPDLSSGSSVRNYYLLRTLTQRYTVDFIGLTDSVQAVDTSVYADLGVSRCIILERKKLPFLQKVLCSTKDTLPYIEQRKQMQLPEEIRASLDRYAAVHLAELNSFFFFEKYLSNITVPVFLDAHNVEHIRFRSEIHHLSFPLSYMGKHAARLVQQLEQRAMAQVNQVFVCSPFDQDYISRQVAQVDITVIPNGVNSKLYTKVPKQNASRPYMLFMGLLSYHPNNEGLQYFFSSIYPALKRQIPDIVIHIIGKEAPVWLQKKATEDPGIVLHGFVDDVRPFIAGATLCIAPLLSGSGTRLKLLEYMAMKKAVVATKKAAEGLAVSHKKHMYLAGNTQEFIDGIAQVYRDPILRQRLAKDGGALVTSHYDWETIGTTMSNVYRQKIGGTV